MARRIGRASDARHARRRAARVRGLVYEPKYDGIRALVDIDPGRRVPVRIWSRLGNEKTAQFPDLVAALTRYAKKLKGPVVLDGEIVALDDKGEPAGFQRLQNRIHLTESNSRSAAGRVAFIAFDILRDRDEDLRPLRLPSGGRGSNASFAIRARPSCESATSSRATRVSSFSMRSITAGKA